jgi:hypothetical protein
VEVVYTCMLGNRFYVLPEVLRVITGGVLCSTITPRYTSLVRFSITSLEAKTRNTKINFKLLSML